MRRYTYLIFIVNWSTQAISSIKFTIILTFLLSKLHYGRNMFKHFESLIKFCHKLILISMIYCNYHMVWNDEIFISTLESINVESVKNANATYIHPLNQEQTQYWMSLVSCFCDLSVTFLYSSICEVRQICFPASIWK